MLGISRSLMMSITTFKMLAVKLSAQHRELDSMFLGLVAPKVESNFTLNIIVYVPTSVLFSK